MPDGYTNDPWVATKNKRSCYEASPCVPISFTWSEPASSPAASRLSLGERPTNRSDFPPTTALDLPIVGSPMSPAVTLGGSNAGSD